MARLPAPPQYIGRGVDLPAPELPRQCANPSCENPATELHHIVRRSHLGGPFDFVEIYGKTWLNLAQVCRDCHALLEANEAVISADERYQRYFWGGWNGNTYQSTPLNPHPFPVLGEAEETAGGTVSIPPGRNSSVSPSTVKPGETCPTCKRRVNHPRKQDSPKSKVISFRVPADEKDALEEAWLARAERLGLAGEKYWKRAFLDVAFNLIDGLSDDVCEAIGRDYRGGA
jgi:hypothetical protein